MASLVDLILKSRASEDGEATLRFAGTDKWLRVDTSRMERTRYIFGSGFAEGEHLTRRGAANVCREA